MAYRECKTLKNDLSLISGCNYAKSMELYSQMENNLYLLSPSKTFRSHIKIHSLSILKLQYDMGLKQYPFYFHSHNGQTFRREIYYHAILPQPNKFCSQDSLSLNTSLSGNLFFCPKALLIANQL